MIAILLAYFDDHRAVRLFGFFHDAIARSRPYKHILIFFDIFVIVFDLQFFAQSAIFFLKKKPMSEICTPLLHVSFPITSFKLSARQSRKA